MGITKKQLLKFIELRNKSEYQSNLQFEIDARAAGFSSTDLGQAIKVKNGDGFEDYVWETSFGKLTEHYGELTLS